MYDHEKINNRRSVSTKCSAFNCLYRLQFEILLYLLDNISQNILKKNVQVSLHSLIFTKHTLLSFTIVFLYIFKSKKCISKLTITTVILWIGGCHWVSLYHPKCMRGWEWNVYLKDYYFMNILVRGIILWFCAKTFVNIFHNPFTIFQS